MGREVGALFQERPGKRSSSKPRIEGGPNAAHDSRTQAAAAAKHIACGPHCVSGRGAEDNAIHLREFGIIEPAGLRVALRYRIKSLSLRVIEVASRIGDCRISSSCFKFILDSLGAA